MKFSMQPGSDDLPKRKPGLSGGGIKLGVLLLMLVLVILAMRRAGDPAAWKWMFPDQKAVEEVQPGNEPNRVEPEEDNSGKGDGNSAADDDTNSLSSFRQGDNVTTSRHFNLTKDSRALDIRIHFWVEILDSMTAFEQLELLALIDHAVEQKPLATGQTAAKSTLLSEISRKRQDLHLRLMQQLPSVNSAALGEEIVTVQQSWDDHVLPAMRAVINDAANSELIDEEVSLFPSVVQRAAWILVEDETQMARPVESYAWFSAWKSVFDEPIVKTKAGDSITITQLLSQPESFRGDRVTVKGTALRIDAQQAGRNDLGIDKYYVIWIRPDHASRFPYCIYSLILPAELAWDETAKRSHMTEQGMEVTGDFFKVRLFDSGEPAQAPVIMTTSVQLTTETVAAGRERNSTLSTPVILLIFVGCAWIAWTVYRVNRAYRARSRREEDPKETKGTLLDLQKDQRVQTVQQKLQKLESESEA